MTYKESITAAMTELGKDPAVCFIGYGLTRGKAMGTLTGVSLEQIIETPVAENLMVGLATGLALRGRKPVVFIERCDFLLNALDAIVNHQAKMDVMSRGQFKPAVIYRIVVGNKTKPLFTGETHVQDFSEALELMVNGEDRASDHCSTWFSVKQFKAHEYIANDIRASFDEAHRRMQDGHSAAFFEYKDLY